MLVPSGAVDKARAHVRIMDGGDGSAKAGEAAHTGSCLSNFTGGIAAVERRLGLRTTRFFFLKVGGKRAPFGGLIFELFQLSSRQTMSDCDFDDEPPQAWKDLGGWDAVFRAKKRDSHSPRGGGTAVLAPDAPKKRAQSIIMEWPALVQSSAQDFLDAALAKKQVEDFLGALVKPPSASRASSLTVGLVAAGIEARPQSRQSLLTFAPSGGDVSTHPFATAANTPGGTRSRSFTADDDEVDDVEVSKKVLDERKSSTCFLATVAPRRSCPNDDTRAGHSLGIDCAKPLGASASGTTLRTPRGE